MVAFYNQGDQEIYDEGEHFIPQEQYRLNKFNNTVAPMPMDGTQQVTQEFGIPYTGAFTNAGGGGGGGFGKFGNLDESNMKMFYDQNVWDGSSWVNKPVKGYWDSNLNTYKTYEGKNIKHAGLFTGDPKKGDIEGEDFQFPGITSAIAQWLKNKAIAAKDKISDTFTGAKDETITDVKDFEQKQATTPGYGSAQGGQGFDAGTGATTTSEYSGRTGQKEMMAQGGRIGFFQGALADTAEGQAMSPGTSATGEFRGGQGDGNNQGDELNISPFLNTEEDKLARHVPVEGGIISDSGLGQLKAMIDFRKLNKALTYGKEDDTVVNSLSDINQLLDPSLSVNTRIGPVDINTFKNKDTDYYGLKTNVGPFNLGYQDLNSQKRADISYAPNDKFTLGANTDFNNYNFGATYQPNDYFTLGGNIDDTGNKYIGGKLTWKGNLADLWPGKEGGLVSIL